MARTRRHRGTWLFRLIGVVLNVLFLPFRLLGSALLHRRVRRAFRLVKPLAAAVAHVVMLPFDLVFLVFDFVAVNALKTKLFRRWRRRRRRTLPSGEVLCRPCAKYTNRFLFRMICKDVSLAARQPICTAKGKRPKKYLLRGATASIIVLAGLAGGVWLLVSLWPRMGPEDADRQDYIRLIQSRLASANSSLDAGDYETARALYKRVVSDVPDLAEANYKLGICCEKLGDIENALRYYGAAARAKTPPPGAVERVAYLLFSQGDLSEATRYAQTAIELDPACALAHAVLADQKTREGDLDKAQDALNPALANAPDDPLVKVVLARLLFAQGKLEEAENILTAIPQQSPLSLLAGVRLADVHLKANRPEQAVETLRGLVANNPDRPGLVIALLNALFLAGRPDEAYKETEDALTTFYEDCGAKLGIAKLLRMYGRQGRALQLALQCTRKGTHAAQAHVLAADIYLEKGLPELAEQHANSALELNPQHRTALLYLGRALLAQGKREAAISVFETLTETHPEESQGWTWLGVSLRNAGRPHEAEAPLRKAIELQPNSARLYEELGRALIDQGKVAEGEKCLERAVELSPALFTAHTRLGMLAEERGERAEAAHHYEAAISAAPSLAVVASNNLANILLSENRNLPLALAMSHFAFNAPQSHAYRADTAETFAHALSKMGYVRNAETIARYAVRLAPEKAETHYRLATVLEQLNKTEEALAECRKALELNPNFEGAQEARKLLEKLAENAGKPPE